VRTQSQLIIIIILIIIMCIGCEWEILIDSVNSSKLQWYQQPKRCCKFCFSNSFKLALHVSGDSFAHLQEHFDCIYSVLELCTDFAFCCRPVTHSLVGSRRQSRYIVPKSCIYTQSAKWAKLSPETCRASLKESIQQNLLHLVGCWYHCTRDARSHKSQVRQSSF